MDNLFHLKMPRSRRKPYTTLTIEQKQQICQRKLKNPQLSDLALGREYRVGKTTIQNIVTQSEKCMSININSVSANTVYLYLDKRLLNFFYNNKLVATVFILLG